MPLAALPRIGTRPQVCGSPLRTRGAVCRATIRFMCSTLLAGEQRLADGRRPRPVHPKAIVEHHGASIGVESAPGAGTRFEFNLPIVGGSSAQADPGLPGFETAHGLIAACGPYSASPAWRLGHSKV